MADGSAAPTVEATALDYDGWAAALSAFFFDPAHQGEEILFAVDDLSLAEASNLGDAAAASLAVAVRSMVGAHWSLSILRNRVRMWRSEGAAGPHPALPLLALTVLAAARMGEHESFAAHNYYGPLRKLLDRNDNELGPPGNFTDFIESLWRDLVTWANDDLGGSHGRLIVREPGFFRFVGLALQHALVKSSDLRHIDAFFRRIGFEPGEHVAPSELRRALAAWTAGRADPWAERLQRVSADPELTTYCEALLAHAAARWDGRPRDPRTGRAVGRLRVGIGSTRRPVAAIYAQWDERLPATTTVSLPGDESLVARRSNGWFEPHPLPNVDVAQALIDGVELRADGFVFSLRPDEVYALAYDDDLGAWISTDSLSFGDRYHLLASSDCVDEVLQFVRRESSLESRLEERVARFLPRGWHLIIDVRLDARPKTSPPMSLASLVPAGAGPRLRLLGGLPIGPAKGVYLRGGEPSLAPSTVSTAEAITITRRSTGEVERLKVPDSADAEIPLWMLRLAPDVYDVRHGESRATLQIVDGIAEIAGPGTGTVSHSGRDSIEVTGTATSSQLDTIRRPVTVRAPRPGEATVLLGHTAGEHVVLGLPPWLVTYIGFEPTWSRIDAWVTFEVVWQMLRGHSGYEAFLMQDREPGCHTQSGRTQWGRMIARATLAPSQSDAAAVLWERYRAKASEL